MADLGLKNVANITYDYQPDPNISSVASGEIQSNTTNDTISSPDVYFEKKTCDTALPKGGVADYTLLAVNQGTASLSNIVINDELPVLNDGTNDYKVNYIAADTVDSATATINGVPAIVDVTKTDLNKPIFTVTALPQVSVTGTGAKIGTITKETVGYNVPFTANFAAGDTITIGGKTFTAGAAADQFAVGADTATTLGSLVTLYNTGTNADPNYRIVVGTPTTTLVLIRTNDPTVTTTQDTGTPITNTVATTADGVTYKTTLSDTDFDKIKTITIGGKTLTVVAATPGTNEFQIGADADATATNIVAALDGNMPTGYAVAVDETDANVLNITEDPKPIIDILPGDSVIIQFKAQVPEGPANYIPGPGKTMPAGADPLMGDVMTNTAGLGFTYDNNGTPKTVAPGTTAEGGKTATVTSEIHQAEIWAEKTLGTLPDPVLKGSNISYVFTLTNKGDREATNVTISDMLPDVFKLSGTTLASPADYEIVAVPDTYAQGTITATVDAATNHLSITGLKVPPSGSAEGTYYDGKITLTLKGKYKAYV